MKIIHLVRTSGLSRFIPMALAVMGLSASTVIAAPAEVVLTIAGKEFGNGKSLNLSSGTWVIAPSKLYEFNLTGTCVGTGDLKDLVPPGTPIGTLLEQIDLGSSSALFGFRENPSKELPLKIFEKNIKGSKTYPIVGKVTYAMSIFSEINASGQLICKLNKVVIKSPAGKVKGTIEFQRGARLTVTSAAEIQFQATGQQVAENAKFVNVVVWRFGNTKEAAFAKFKTVQGTATAPDDFMMKSGTVSFRPGKTQSIIKVPIKKNPQKDPFRKFTIELFEPGPGAAFGDRVITTIGITGDPS